MKIKVDNTLAMTNLSTDVMIAMTTAAPAMVDMNKTKKNTKNLSALAWKPVNNHQRTARKPEWKRK